LAIVDNVVWFKGILKLWKDITTNLRLTILRCLWILAETVS
jgi:hypothetical protein